MCDNMQAGVCACVRVCVCVCVYVCMQMIHTSNNIIYLPLREMGPIGFEIKELASASYIS